MRVGDVMRRLMPPKAPTAQGWAAWLTLCSLATVLRVLGRLWVGGPEGRGCRGADGG